MPAVVLVFYVLYTTYVVFDATGTISEYSQERYEASERYFKELE